MWSLQLVSVCFHRVPSGFACHSFCSLPLFLLFSPFVCSVSVPAQIEFVLWKYGIYQANPYLCLRNLRRENMIEVTDAALRQAAAEGMDAFIQVFTDAYKEVTGGKLTAETMPLLTGEQHSLLAYALFRDEVMEGGFCQLIQNGYGGYIFDNPFAKVMRLWGVDNLHKLVYAAKKIYDAHRADLERERTDDEFMAMYEQYEAFDELEDEFLEKEEEYTAAVAGYVDEHLDLFAKIV